jgi:anti-sigma B factor antagonist
MESWILGALADDGTATVIVQGEIDFSNADELAQHLYAAVADWSPTTVRVDLAQASFIDSTGVGALIEGYRAAGAAGIRYIVVNPTDGLRRLLTVTGLSELFGLAERDWAGPAERDWAGPAERDRASLAQRDRASLAELDYAPELEEEAAQAAGA